MNLTFNIADLLKAALPTVGFLTPFVMALVKWYGGLGVTGKWQLVSSMITGLVLGGATMYVELQPKTAADYLVVVLTGLITGLVASGVYDMGKDLVAKATKS